MDPEFIAQGCEPTLERADDACGDTRGVPVHAHDGAEGLKPEGVREAAQEFVASVMMHDGLADYGANLGHALPPPCRHKAAMEGKSALRRKFAPMRVQRAI
jgi:hypothetical protein